jgi:hypothetical protein
LGLDEAPSGTREDYRRARRHVNGDSPVAQPPLKVVEVCLQVAEEQRRLAGRGCDGRVVRVEGQMMLSQPNQPKIYLRAETCAKSK